jgi:hypothetical protein
MRQQLSVLYGGGWKERLDAMSDRQVYAIFQKRLEQQRKQPKEKQS